MRRAVSAIVLAGGASSRMGFNKAFAMLDRPGSDGKTALIEIVVATVRRLSPEVIVVANDVPRYSGLAARVVPDVYQGAGSLGGIYAGLLAAGHEHSLVVGCDMPFLCLPLWRYMLSLTRDYDVLLPRFGGQTEPLHAIYSTRCLRPIRALLEQGQYRVTGFLDQVRVRFLDQAEIDRFDPGHRSFFNVNTPEDLARASAPEGGEKCGNEGNASET